MGDLTNQKVAVICGGDVSVQIQTESVIHLKAVSDLGDPVELLPRQARELANLLRDYADAIEKMDGDYDWGGSAAKN